jgi:hypothetical protein
MRRQKKLTYRQLVSNAKDQDALLQRVLAQREKYYSEAEQTKAALSKAERDVTHLRETQKFLNETAARWEERARTMSICTRGRDEFREQTQVGVGHPVGALGFNR